MLALMQLAAALVLTAKAEDFGNSETDAILAFSLASSSSRVEGVVLSFLFWLISFVSAMLAALLVSFAYHESQLMHQYKWQGLRVTANVWNTEFVRMRRQTKACSSCQSCDPNHSQLDGADSELGDEEYIANIEYRLNPELFGRDCRNKSTGAPYIECPSSAQPTSASVLPTGDCLVVRKQVKACTSDFNSAAQEKSAACAHGDSPRIHVDFRDSPIMDAERTATADLEPQLLYLHLLVVPGYKNSGLPHQHVERMCSISYRLPTIVMGLGLLVLCVISSYFGVRSFLTIRIQEDGSAAAEQANSWDLYLGMTTVVGLNVFAGMALSWCVVSNWIKQMLRAEFLDGGDDVLPPPLGDSYSISSGDDAYLMF